MTNNFVICVYAKVEDLKAGEGIPIKPEQVQFANGLEDLLTGVHNLGKENREYRVFELGKCVTDTTKFWEKDGEEWKQKNLSQV